MLDDSLFVSDALVERQVKIGGKEHRLWFKELPAVEFIKFHQVTDQDAKAGAAAKLIAASLRNADGTPALTYDKALTLKSAALNAIFAAVLEVNGGTPGNG